MTSNSKNINIQKAVRSSGVSGGAESSSSSSLSSSPWNEWVFSENNVEKMKRRFLQEALKAHNKCRAKHGVDDLKLNPELNEIAQRYADHLAETKKELSLSYNKYQDKVLGESMGFFYDHKVNYFTGEFVTLCWYNEIKDYDFDKNLYQLRTRHFSQIVWKNSREVGFGIALAKEGGFYVVANYHPAGNVLGLYSQNVLKPIAE